jgi:hypothetical protein
MIASGEVDANHEPPSCREGDAKWAYECGFAAGQAANRLSDMKVPFSTMRFDAAG